MHPAGGVLDDHSVRTGHAAGLDTGVATELHRWIVTG
jgi:hypothetical protein